ncbi:hypothetical protein GPECTOR_22g946 [Gonium pectorale]|uniref:Uncharacterized protein n=1 Tax=Gonium pectorale TaxID=33097 RepID=A0A150GHM8_GONPE|nr:hypothetical protein GPECTOR_22g946 [Gonium pectorale]|eukprot:KXZ49352.1 hypothetical protein GPECTOR_22g946 [Gonium pectorale]
MQSAVRQKEADVEALQSSVDEVARVRELVTKLPEKVRHKAMVPYGKHAFFEGELVHTNEFLVGLGCDLRLEASATQTAALLGRRQARGEEALRAARAQLEEMRFKVQELQLSLSNEEGEGFMEIRQDFDESEELLASAALTAATSARPKPTTALVAGCAASRGQDAERAASGEAAASGSGRGVGANVKGYDAEDERIFSRLAELERLEQEAGSDGVEGEAGSRDGADAAPSTSAGDAARAADKEPARQAPAEPAGAKAGAKAVAQLKKGFLLGGTKKGKPASLARPGGPEAAPDGVSPSPSGGSSSAARSPGRNGATTQAVLKSPSPAPGVLRLWVTPGRGGFTTLEMGGGEPAMYVLALGDTYEIERTEAWDAIVAEQTILPTMTSSVLGNQHLLTTVFQLVAHEQDAQVAIFTDPEGFVQHCAGYMLCILTQMDVLVFPPSETTTPSLTLARLLELIPGEKERSPDDVIVSDVQQRQLHISEVLSAKECFLVGTTYTIAPVRSVDGQPIADNSTGLTTLALHYMLENDKQAPPAGVFSPLHTPVPYGFMTGMRSHLT